MSRKEDGVLQAEETVCKPAATSTFSICRKMGPPRQGPNVFSFTETIPRDQLYRALERNETTVISTQYTDYVVLHLAEQDKVTPASLLFTAPKASTEPDATNEFGFKPV